MYLYNVFDDAIQLRDLVNSFFNEASTRVRKREFPEIDFYEGNEEIEIQALIPGVASDDIDVHLVNDTIVIEGEKKEDYADSTYLRRERNFGRFKKAVKLPYRVEADKIDAQLRNGILTLRLYKSEDAKPKKIDIK